jgi:hypothetical protein
MKSSSLLRHPKNKRFSREGSEKVYVQHRLKENAELVSDLLKQKANFYVCGDAANFDLGRSEQVMSVSRFGFQVQGVVYIP